MWARLKAECRWLKAENPSGTSLRTEGARKQRSVGFQPSALTIAGWRIRTFVGIAG
jgi:hypothetical protein